MENPEGKEVVASLIRVRRSRKNDEAVYHPRRVPGQRVLEKVWDVS